VLMYRGRGDEGIEGVQCNRDNVPKVLTFGGGTGALSGFFGIGGGFLIVPALVLALGLPMRIAVGTSLVIIAINSASGVLAHLATGGFDLEGALIFIIGGFVGSQLGSRFAGRIDDRKLSKGFAAMVAVVGLYLIVQNAPQLLGGGAAEAAQAIAGR